MKNFKMLIVLLVLFALACTGNNSQADHGHEHGPDTHEHANDDGHSHEHGEADHSHEHGDHHEQQEFTVEADSVKIQNDSTHTHEDGTTHHNH